MAFPNLLVPHAVGRCLSRSARTSTLALAVLCPACGRTPLGLFGTHGTSAGGTAPGNADASSARSSMGGAGGAVATGGGAGLGGGARPGSGGISAGSGGAIATAGAAGFDAGVDGAAGSLDSGFGGDAGIDAAEGLDGESGTPPTATLLALGAFHSCAYANDRLRCWGTSYYNGLGNTTTIGDDETPDMAGDVDIGGSVVQIAASWWHTCAVLDTGKVRCFGTGSLGALGYGNTEDIGDDETPASAGDVTVGGRVRQVAVGPFHTCACLENGKVRCWGENDRFQLGYASPETIGDDEHPASAGDVDVGGFVVQVAAGNTHTCALLDTGAVRCWGWAAGGHLGYGNTEDIGDDETPAAAGDVDVGGKVTQLVAGGYHTCALLDDGTVRCWGRNRTNVGPLGFGNTEEDIGDDETPASAGPIDIGGTVTQLAAGDFGTCARLTSGAVRCWGLSVHGELGYGNTEDIGDDETPASAGDVDVGGPVTHIDMGFYHTCAILEGGAVRCWGRASTGALGYGNTEDIGDDETPATAGDVSVW